MSFWATFIQKKEQGRESLLDSVHYQLTALLNSDAPMRLVPAVYEEANQSILCFGLDSGQSISSQVDKDQFSRSLEKMIRAFEPRLSDVSVFVNETDPSKNVMSFSIMAKVETGQGEHVFLFDSNISLSNQFADMEGQEIV